MVKLASNFFHLLVDFLYPTRHTKISCNILKTEIVDFARTSRGINLSAPNTIAMAFYSNKMVAPCKMLWAIQGLKDEDAKILGLWFNSTINISQILSRRAETEGAFMGLDQYILQQFLVVDPSKLDEQQKKRLVQLFDEHAKTQLPSVLDQLKNQTPVRKAIDLAILEALGIKDNLEDLLSSAYENVAKTIETLATLMKEGEGPSKSEA